MKKGKYIILIAAIILVAVAGGVLLQVFMRTKTATARAATATTAPASAVQTTAPPTTTTQPTTKANPNEDILLLVNDRNPLPETYEPELVETEGGLLIDKRAKNALEEMLDGCRAAGHQPLACSIYRSREKQAELYNTKLRTLHNEGYPMEEAKKETLQWIAYPGTSEHHTGLAADIVDLNFQLLDERQEETETQKWLMQHCTEYGFILRYPSSKSAITHIHYEPWHYRYVGKADAKKIQESGLCLEEYKK